jgi:hypothetical protein
MTRCVSISSLLVPSPAVRCLRLSCTMCFCLRSGSCAVGIAARAEAIRAMCRPAQAPNLTALFACHDIKLSRVYLPWSDTVHERQHTRRRLAISCQTRPSRLGGCATWQRKAELDLYSANPDEVAARHFLHQHCVAVFREPPVDTLSGCSVPHQLIIQVSVNLQFAQHNTIGDHICA